MTRSEIAQFPTRSREMCEEKQDYSIARVFFAPENLQANVCPKLGSHVES